MWDEQLARQAVALALERYPDFSPHGPRLVFHDLPGGGAYTLAFERHPGRGAPGLWDFQNTAVRAYKALAAGRTPSEDDLACGH